MKDEFYSILKSTGQSVTKPRLAVFDTLLTADTPLKNGEIARRTASVDRASVYRTLELFAQLDITTTTIRGWTPFTELAEPFKPHHHHLTCSVCGAIEEIASDTLENMLNAIALRHDFRLTSHIVELTGTCTNCQNKTSAT